MAQIKQVYKFVPLVAGLSPNINNCKKCDEVTFPEASNEEFCEDCKESKESERKFHLISV